MILVFLLFLVIISYTYALCAFGTWLVCVAFGIGFTWLRALAVWFVLNIIIGFIKITIVE